MAGTAAVLSGFQPNAAIGFGVDARELGEAGHWLSEAARRMSDLTPLMDELGGAMVASTQARFEAEKAPDGTPWERSARAVHEGGQTLRDSNRLYQSITHRAGRQHVAWGTNVIYAAVHQFGATIRPKSANALAFALPGGDFAQVQKVEIPARPFLGVSRDDQAEIGRTVEGFLGREVFR